MTQPSQPPRIAPTGDEREPAKRSLWPWWLTTIVILGSLLTATGAVMALFASGEHLNPAGQNYADYFATRNLAMAAMLAVMLALRARRVLAALMILTALIQLLDAVSAAATGRLTLIPVDLVFTAVFLIGAAQLTAHRFWRASTWQHHE